METGWRMPSFILDELKELYDERERVATPRPLEEWHEDYGDVLWWKFPVEEPPYCGTPLDASWIDYHTHWTPLIYPVLGEEEHS